VLTLWAAVVAEVLRFEPGEALTLGRAVAGLNAYSKGVSLGLFQPTPKEVQGQGRKMRKEETVTVALLHRAVPAKHTDERLRAVSGESPMHSEGLHGEPCRCHTGDTDNFYPLFSLSFPRISSIIFPYSRQIDRRMVSIGQE
jgi:hypothetical protein